MENNMLYSYKCPSCDEQDYFDHSMNDRPTFKCKECGSIMIKELCTNFIKKGFGWPSQDFKEKTDRKKRSEQLKKSQRDTGLSIYDKTSDGRKIKSEQERKKNIDNGTAEAKLWV